MSVLGMESSASLCTKLIKESLSCPICKETFNTAVLINSCSHNFCSICIRRYFTIKQECPICGQDASQGNLVPNRVLEALIQRFDELNTLLDRECHLLAKQPIEQPLVKQEQSKCGVSEDDGDRHVLERPSTSAVTPVSSQDSDCVIVENTPEFSLGLKEFCTQSHSLSTDATQLGSMSKELFPSSTEAKVENVSTEHVSTAECTEERPPVTVDEASSNTPVGAAGVTEIQAIAPEKADCPVCGLNVLCLKMNSHLDNCLAREEKKLSLRRNVPKRQKPNHPVVKLAYNLLSLRGLRQKLKELGIWTTGDKPVLIRRHQEFVAKYQAEQDKLKPRRLSILLEELQREEEARDRCQRSTRQRAKKRVMLGHDPPAMDTTTQRKKYLKKNSEQYKVLEEQVKKSFPPKRRRKEIERSVTSVATTSTALSPTDVCPDSQSSTTSTADIMLTAEFLKPCSDATEGRLSPELYVGPTPSALDEDSNEAETTMNLRQALEMDSQAALVKQYIDASLPNTEE